MMGYLRKARIVCDFLPDFILEAKHFLKLSIAIVVLFSNLPPSLHGLPERSHNTHCISQCGAVLFNRPLVISYSDVSRLEVIPKADHDSGEFLAR